MASEQAFNPPESENLCCAELKKKYSKLQESRNALREAVKLLEGTVNKFEAQNANLKKAYQEELARAKTEKEEALKEFNAKVSLENEVSALKSEITALQQKCGTGAQEENGDLKALKADIYDKEKEIERLKKLVEKEKKRADSERRVAENEKKKAAEAYKLLEAEKKVSLDKGMQLSKIEAEKAEEYRLQQVHLEKEVTEIKMKLASELSKFKEAIKRVETEKQKLLVEKRNAESKVKKAQEHVEVEKQKAVREKRRADEEHVKVEEQKRLAQDNWKSAKEAKQLAHQRSQELLKEKKITEGLKKTIHELSSLRKPNEISGVSPNANAESDKIQLLKSNLELEKLRAKHAREKLKHEKKFEHERMKFKYEESCRSILQHELHRLKLDFIQNYNHLTMLDASFSPVAGSIHDLAKSWQWTNTKLVPQLLHVLDSFAVENAAVAIIVLLGQLGRFDKSFYPMTDEGSYDKVGEGIGAGYNINLPWKHGGRTNSDYIEAFNEVLLPVAEAYKPDIVIVSAGFDAADGDAMGNCKVTPDGFSILLKKLMAFAEGRIVLILEGGYNPTANAASMEACIHALLGDKTIEED